MNLTLYPFQKKIIQEVRDHIKNGIKNILICSPTGSGKTALTTFMLSNAAIKGKKCLFVVHRRELISQSSKAFEDNNVMFGIVAAGIPEKFYQPLSKIQICSIGTLVSRKDSPEMDFIKNADIIVFDEVQHILCNTWSSIYNMYPNSIKLGLSASPVRLNGEGFDKHFDKMVNGPSTADLIKDKYLCPYEYYCPKSISFNKIKNKFGDYDSSSVDEILSNTPIIGDAVESYKKYANNSKAVVFCHSVKFSKKMAEKFRAAGIQAVHLDGNTPSHERDLIIKKFRIGDIKVITNVDIIMEGFDLPDLHTVITLRPTASLVVYLQQIGRVLRYKPNKVAVILDHVGNVTRHNLPCAKREWSLKGFEKEDTYKNLAKICKKCFAAIPISAKKCSYCGHIIPVIEKAPIDQKKGELTKVDKQKAQEFLNKEYEREWKKREVRNAKTREALMRIAVNRNYRKGWVDHQLRLKSKRRWRNA